MPNLNSIIRSQTVIGEQMMELYAADVREERRLYTEGKLPERTAEDLALGGPLIADPYQGFDFPAPTQSEQSPTGPVLR